MDDSGLTSVQISKRALRLLGEIAANQRRSKTGQLEWMIEVEHKRMRVVSVEIAPHPPDAQGFPIVTVEPAGDETDLDFQS